MIVMDLRDALQAQMNSTIMLMRASGYSEQDILDCTSQARAALADDLRAPSPCASASTIPTCCITGAIPGDGGACGDCDPCIFGEALVPKAVKRLIAEKNSLLQRVGELEDAASIAAEESDTPEREALADIAFAENMLAEHIEQFHDFDYQPHEVPAELASLRHIQHHLAGSLIDEHGNPRTVAERATEPDMVAVPKSALDWLFGEGHDAEGEHFDESKAVAEATGKLRPYWWRSYFRKLIGQHSSDSKSPDLAKLRD